jgi:hypothetical protein
MKWQKMSIGKIIAQENAATEAKKQKWRNLPFFCRRHKRKLKMSFAN